MVQGQGKFRVVSVTTGRFGRVKSTVFIADTREEAEKLADRASKALGRDTSIGIEKIKPGEPGFREVIVGPVPSERGRDIRRARERTEKIIKKAAAGKEISIGEKQFVKKTTGKTVEEFKPKPTKPLPFQVTPSKRIGDRIERERKILTTGGLPLTILGIPGKLEVKPTQPKTFLEKRFTPLGAIGPVPKEELELTPGLKRKEKLSRQILFGSPLVAAGAELVSVGIPRAVKAIPIAAAFGAAALLFPTIVAPIAVGAVAVSIPSLQREFRTVGVLRTTARETPSLLLFGAAAKAGAVARIGVTKAVVGIKTFKFERGLKEFETRITEKGVGFKLKPFVIVTKEPPKFLQTTLKGEVITPEKLRFLTERPEFISKAEAQKLDIFGPEIEASILRDISIGGLGKKETQLQLRRSFPLPEQKAAFVLSQVPRVEVKTKQTRFGFIIKGKKGQIGLAPSGLLKPHDLLGGIRTIEKGARKVRARIEVGLPKARERIKPRISLISAVSPIERTRPISKISPILKATPITEITPLIEPKVSHLFEPIIKPRIAQKPKVTPRLALTPRFDIGTITAPALDFPTTAPTTPQFPVTPPTKPFILPPALIFGLPKIKKVKKKKEEKDFLISPFDPKKISSVIAAFRNIKGPFPKGPLTGLEIQPLKE